MEKKLATLGKLSRQQQVVLVPVILALVLGAGVYYLYSQLVGELALVQGNAASTTAMLEQRVGELENNITIIREENSDLNAAIEAAEERRRDVEDQIENISDVVGTLEKLSKTDKELLQKYSKVYFLNEHYVPTNLTSIPRQYLSDQTRDMQLHSQVWPELRRLLVAAAREDITLQIVSAYRDFGTQAGLKASYNFTYGVGTANQFSAEQGYSEHQLGTTVDLTTPEIGGALAGFENTPAYRWLTNNAYRYGFVLSYPPNNNYYQFEPWHWRFVGTDLARRLYRDKIYFYDLEQREIDKYLAEIFD